jgi:chromosome segregation protein
MRLLTLDLERYGHFTGRTINFSREAKLHVVYGPNEAGKTCALAAVTDLFFGIGHRTPYDFQHEGKDLRIGGAVISRDGSYLVFRRRKGNRGTIVDASDDGLGDDVLLPYLGGLTREVFSNAFGLDSEALRRGAEEMLTSDGEIGASLFAAASGLRGLAELRRRLEDEAGTIFASRASRDRKFYQALGRLEEARKAIHDRELRAGYWTELNERIEGFSRRLDEIKTLRGVKAAERARFSRNKRIAPLVQLIDNDVDRLRALGPMPDVPIGFSKALHETLEAVRAATETRKRLADDEAKATRDHAEISIDKALLARAGDVLRLIGDTGAYASNRRDLPRIQAETDEYRGLLAQLALRLGLPDESAVEAAQPTDAAQALVRSLISEGRNLTDALDRNKVSLATERTALAELEQERAHRGGSVNPQPLREKFAAFAPVLGNLEKRIDVDHTIRVETRSLVETAGRLDPPVNNLDALAAAATPGLDTIARFRNDLNALEVEVQRQCDRLSVATEAGTTIKSKLRDLTSARPVPSAEVIATKRQQRDAEWSVLRATLFGSSERLAGERLTEVVACFERYSSEADQLADHALSDAERVAAHAVQTRRLEEEGRKEVEAKDRIAVLENKRQEILTLWTAAWVPTGIEPLHPSEMISWRSALEALLDRREKIDNHRDELTAMDGAARSIEPSLRALAAEVGLRDIEEADVAFVAAQIKERLQVLIESWDAGRDLDTRIRDAQHRVQRLTETAADVERGLEEWSARWRVALPAIGLHAIATIEEAQAAIDAWDEVPGAVRERNNRARRVSGMQRNIETFEREAKDLAGQIAPDLTALPADATVKMLNDRLIAARAAESRRTETQRRLMDMTRARDEAEKAAMELETELSVVAAKLPPGTDLTDLVTRLTERDVLFDSLRERRMHLMTQGEGYGETQLRADLADFNSDDVESKLEVLSEEDQDLEREAQEVYAAHDQAVRERATAEQGIGAEVAAQQHASAEAELMEASREWAVLKLGALLLGTAIDRRRATQHDPLMARAGVLFALLTGGSFADVAQSFDDRDMPHLVGRRLTGETVPVSGMSTGARDQLYLALRLAYLEQYAARAEPAPFIGDDLFASFDDDRTANGLAALAAIGDLVQPIVFTHHRHVAEIAQSKLGADVFVL